MTARALPDRDTFPDWPRLLSVPLAARYCGISPTSLRAHGPAPKNLGNRVLYDRRDLDRWADRLGEQPMDEPDRLLEAENVEKRFLESRNAGG